MRILFLILSVLCCSGVTVSDAYGQSDTVKNQLVSNAKKMCEIAAQKKYGVESVKSVNDRVRWSKGHKGALVKMKIKPATKRLQKYHCIVDSSSTAIFYRV